MRWSLLTLVFAAGLVLAADDPKPDDVKKELAKFQGAWKAVSIIRDGEAAIEEESLKELKLFIDGEKRTLKIGDNVVSEGTFKLNPAKKPKEIDVTVVEGPLKGKTMPGIYEIDGDKQKMCLQINTMDRPKEFTSKADSGHLLQVFEREKK